MEIPQVVLLIGGLAVGLAFVVILVFFLSRRRVDLMCTAFQRAVQEWERR